ncbi:8-amino-7-oxononanoate synthase [Vibrio salinus]|uniref:8-amino-7-oxononanoate synthase n=1 Tax=Vibrio salinus TaxID=2899784 RepID=UPI001E646145|nr:8-amino-7-oxononanoate synthase [Vibrio salinus]MCE0496207.1 8-amino-7-oxononanoate synthase [Vibrio salinus]
MHLFDQRITSALQERKALGLERRVLKIDNGNTKELCFGDRNYLNFSSNDYLGLANDTELIRKWQQGLDRFGAGSSSSPMVVGNSYPHELLKTSLCEWLDYDECVLFNSGFSANQALITSLFKKGDLLLQDKLNHASLMEAGMLSPATMKRFRHNDIKHLVSFLRDEDHPTAVITEGVFSMDGDMASVREMHQAIGNKAILIVDDAHGIGVLGEQGKGSTHLAGVKPDLLVVTFGKAFGLSGAAIMCSHSVGDYINQFARHHVYSTAMPPSQAYALNHAVFMIKEQQWRRDKLAELQALFHKRMSPFGAHYVETVTAIKPILIGGVNETIAVAEQIRRQGIWITGIRPPTVPAGQGRLRVTLTSGHSVTDVDKLCSCLEHTLENLHVAHDCE